MRKWIGAAAIGCGIALSAWADKPGLSATTMQRLLLEDAERVGKRVVAVGDRGYIVVSDDQGKSWRRAKAPAAPLLTAVDFLDGQLGIAVGHDAVILTTGDGGETWSLRSSA